MMLAPAAANLGGAELGEGGIEIVADEAAFTQKRGRFVDDGEGQFSHQLRQGVQTTDERIDERAADGLGAVGHAGHEGK